MNYEEALLKQIDIYIDEILPAYHMTTVEGMKMAKKFRLFKKIDFMKYAHEFEEHKANALKLESMELRIPEELVDLCMLEKDFRKCLLSFVILCDANILFYELNEKKQYKNKDFTIKEYTEAVNDMQEALRDAVLESQILEKSYKEYLAEHGVQTAEAEEAEPEETE
ncbi:MAG: hypothetical protein IKL30_04095 [Anaerotignum sp.]|nr:hypothetical protein [Anaerotignum sp.]